MISKDAYRDPSEVYEATVDEFAIQLERHLNQASDEAKCKFGEKVSKIIDHIIPPGVRSKYRSNESVIGLVAFEVAQMGQKIRRYQYIERYKFFFNTTDKEIGMGFAEHMYALRNAELYGVLERGEAVVRFVSAVGTDLDIGSDKAPAKYAKSFKKHFERRLKERHRMTHAHERRSLLSRLLQLSPVNGDGDREVLENLLGNVLGTMSAALASIQDQVPAARQAPPIADPTAFQAWYLKSVDDEAAAMWKIFTDAVASAAGLGNVE